MSNNRTIILGVGISLMMLLIECKSTYNAQKAVSNLQTANSGYDFHPN